MTGCCDVVFEKDVLTFRVMSEMCSRVIGVPEGAAMTPARVATCRAAVLQRCDIDIAAFLNEQVKLGRSHRQILDELRSFNTSVCLRLHFGVSPASLGAPRRMRTWESSISRKPSAKLITGCCVVWKLTKNYFKQSKNHQPCPQWRICPS